jgi:hypothetical protein
MAKHRRLSANRMLVELVEEGIEAQRQKEKAFFELAGRFRANDIRSVNAQAATVGELPEQAPSFCPGSRLAASNFES